MVRPMRARNLRCAGKGALALLATLSASAAWAGDTVCRPASHLSPCIDAEALWTAPGDSRFVAIASTTPTPRARVALGVQGQYLWRPLVASVPSPHQAGREVRLVESALDQTLLLEGGLGRGLSVGLSMGVALIQRGSGIEGLTSRNGAPLARTAPRDARLSLTLSESVGRWFGVEPRVVIVIPVGDQTAFAGGSGLSAAPAVALEARAGRFSLGADLGLRLRRSVDFGTARWGSQASLAVGMRWELKQRSLWVTAEAFTLPSLTDPNSELGRALGIRTRLIPGEWLASLGIRPDPESQWSVRLGAGSGLLLSKEGRGGTVRVYAGPTSPRLRALIGVFYVPE